MGDYTDLANALTYSDGTGNPAAIPSGPLLSGVQGSGGASISSPKSTIGSSTRSSSSAYSGLQGTPGTPPQQPNIIDPVHGVMEDTVGDTGAAIMDPVGSVIGAVTGKIICTELHRQGMMTNDVFDADQAYGRIMWVADPDVMVGYHLWAPTIVRWMQSSRFVTAVTIIIAMTWARQMAFVMGVEEKGTIRGAAIMAAGKWFCRVLGCWSSARGRKAAATGAADV